MTYGYTRNGSPKVWTVYPDGRIVFKADITSTKPELVPGRIGFLFRIPSDLNVFKYYGRGPEENYCDRETANMRGCYVSSPAAELVNYTKPQECGNHEDVFWASLSDGRNCGIMVKALSNSIKGEAVMSVAALPYSAMDLMMAAHPHQLPEPGDTTYLTVDAAVLGLGGASCGQPPLRASHSRGEQPTTSMNCFRKLLLSGMPTHSPRISRGSPGLHFSRHLASLILYSLRSWRKVFPSLVLQKDDNC